MHSREEKLQAFGRLLDIMDTLREKCPWNAEQTFDSIRRLTEEEVYELSETILEGDRPGTAKEIGDLLYHMVFYARIGQEEGAFDIADSINKVCDKMVFRHPHVFGPDAGKETSAKEIADTWELVKAKEKGGNKRVMAGIPKAMPAMLKALSMQEKARGCGFDWEKKEDVWDKVGEGRFENPYSKAELAWTSFPGVVDKFVCYQMGFISADKSERIHPTQKPVALYKWILSNYAKPGDKILDTHVGSASSLIACYDMGFDYVGFEIDEEYYKKAKQRLEDEMAQVRFTW